MLKKTYSLNNQQLAILFGQLRQLESAGLPCFKAFEMISQSAGHQKDLFLLALKYLKLGKPVSEAGYQAGIFNQGFRSLIEAAEASGRLAEVYGRLADYYAAAAMRNKKIKSRLLLPALTLVISLFVQPLPELIGSRISGLQYLRGSIGTLLIIVVSLSVLVRLQNIMTALGLQNSWDSLVLKMPLIGKWIIHRQINEFLFILAMMLDTGVAFDQALPKAVATLENTRLRALFRAALMTLGNGSTVFDRLSKVSVIDTKILQIVKTSEQSGKLASGLLQMIRLESEAIRLQDEALAEWIPRLAYFLIGSWIAFSILGSRAFP